jgi:hypothetical protein
MINADEAFGKSNAKRGRGNCGRACAQCGSYFLDFSEETFREASKYEFVPLPFGAWTWKPMTHGEFGPPLPFRNVNEYRIPLSGGRVLTVEF